jgi:hypothetical protein
MVSPELRDGARAIAEDGDHFELLDAWGKPILFLRSLHSSDQGRGYLVSFGPDGKWEELAGDDIAMTISDDPELLSPPSARGK